MRFPSRRSHNFETKAKLNEARHPFLKGISWNLPADFQAILSEDALKRTKNFHPYMRFNFIEKTTKNLL